MQHRRVVFGGQLAGMAAIAAGLMLTTTGESVLGPLLLAAAFLLITASTWVLARTRNAGPAAPAASSTTPAAPTVGRSAALEGSPADDARSYLGNLILERQGEAADSRPTILTVAGPALIRRLEPFGPVAQLQPGTAAEQIRRGAPRMLVIDRRVFESGLWAHAETGAGSVLFRDLADLIRGCQALHIATIFLDSGAPDRFYTSTLRKLCRNVMPLPLEDLHPEGTAGSALLTELQIWSRTEPAHVR